MNFDQPVGTALDRLYAAFAAVPAPAAIPHCDHCVPAGEIAALLAAGPVRGVPAGLLQGYTANLVVATAGSPPDARYFAPRLLDIATGMRGSYPGLAAVARHLGVAVGTWTAAERAAVAGFLGALWRHRLTTWDDAGWRPPAAELLGAISHFTDDLGPGLDLWARLLGQAPPAAGHLVLLLQDCRREAGRLWLPDVRGDRNAERLDAWLRGDELRFLVSGLYNAAPDDDDAFMLTVELVWAFGHDPDAAGA